MKNCHEYQSRHWISTDQQKYVDLSDHIGEAIFGVENNHNPLMFAQIGGDLPSLRTNPFHMCWLLDIISPLDHYVYIYIYTSNYINIKCLMVQFGLIIYKVH